MTKPGANPVERQSVDLVKENIARLKELFPEAVSEGKVGECPDLSWRFDDYSCLRAYALLAFMATACS